MILYEPVIVVLRLEELEAALLLLRKEDVDAVTGTVEFRNP